MNRKNNKTDITRLLIVSIFIIMLIGWVWAHIREAKTDNNVAGAVSKTVAAGSFDMSAIPAYSGSPYAVVNDNIPFFAESDLASKSYEKYGSLDALGRCTTCVASVGKDLMPNESRGEIGSIKPTGWIQAKYAGLVDGNYLYNRCHLIGFQLTAENANEKNLITGTRYLNVDGMLPFENMVADYVRETNKHVLYRVTPIFEGNNALASGVLMEAESVEDKGEDILFCVFCYNVQPGVDIDYSTGKSSLAEDVFSTQDNMTKGGENTGDAQTGKYAVNGNNGKIHIVGKCKATGDGDGAVKNLVYFDTIKEAETYTKKNYPDQKKPRCGNCW